MASGTKPTRRGPAEWFTGTDWQDPVVEAPAPARVSFEPGARTAWHVRPLGQTLHVVWLERVSDEEYAAALAA